MTGDLRRELERWGFSDTEVDVYLAALDVSEGTASAVGDRADVSARHVYRVCERLEERGLVDIDEHVQPTQVRARPPSAVEEVIDRSASTMVEEITSRYTRSPDDPTDIEVLKRQPTVLDRARTLLDGAERWAILVAPADVVEELEAELASALDRGILVLLVTTVDSLSTDRSLGDLATVVGTRDGPMGFQEFGLGVDTVRSLMVAPSARMGDEHRHSPALFLDDETVGVRTNDSLQGIELRQSREHTVPDLVELPYESGFFREIILHAAIHEHAGTTLHARVEGRSIDGGEQTTLDGEVTAVRQEMVEPYDTTFLGERTLVVETGEGRVTVGGVDATMEDYAADHVTLSAADDADS